MTRLAAFLMCLLLCGPASASGYGWYVATLDWNALQKLRPQLDAAVARERKTSPQYGRDGWEIRALSDALAIDEAPGPGQIALKDVSPPELEFYWPDALEYAYKQQRKAGIADSGFGLFRQGRSLWRPDSASVECGDGEWYCLDAYFFLSPEEVVQFSAEVKALNARVKHAGDYRDYLTHLQGVLRDAVAAKQGLYFYGHD